MPSMPRIRGGFPFTAAQQQRQRRRFSAQPIRPAQAALRPGFDATHAQQQLHLQHRRQQQQLGTVLGAATTTVAAGGAGVLSFGNGALQFNSPLISHQQINATVAAATPLPDAHKRRMSAPATTVQQQEEGERRRRVLAFQARRAPSSTYLFVFVFVFCLFVCLFVCLFDSLPV